MNHLEQSNETENHATAFGMNPDDMSMLNEVLQQVKGISCVSTPAYEIVEPSYNTDI